MLYPPNAIPRLLIGNKGQAALLVPQIQQTVRKHPLLPRPPLLQLLESSQALLKLFVHGDLLSKLGLASSQT
jgi:hypothetical protein